MKETSAYNATVVGKILITPDIMTLRVNADEPRPEFEAGQYTVLGLYGHEGRSQNSEEEHALSPEDKLIRRAYSIASRRADTQQFEFYISQVKTGQLTPRLFNLEMGSRLHLGKRIVGLFKLSETPLDSDIVMVATGTGIAPYISFLRSHIVERPNIRMAVIQGATHQWDLGYYSELTFLANSFPNFYYFPTLTDADDTWGGKRLWINELLDANVLQEEAQIRFDIEKTHFFLCGNPKMVETTSKWLAPYGYKKHTKKEPGSLHVEEF